MLNFLNKNAKQLKKIILIALMVIPFFLYFAAIHDWTLLLYALLGLTGFTMLLALKVG